MGLSGKFRWRLSFDSATMTHEQVWGMGGRGGVDAARANSVRCPSTPRRRARARHAPWCCCDGGPHGPGGQRRVRGRGSRQDRPLPAGDDVSRGELEDPQLCDGPLPAGLVHDAALPPDRRAAADSGLCDILQLGFATASGSVVQLYFDRRRRTFEQADLEVLRMVTPAIRRLVRGSKSSTILTCLTGSEERCFPSCRAALRIARSPRNSS